MEAACKAMNTCKIHVVQGNTLHLDDVGDPSDVVISNLGSFDDDGVKVLLKFCSIANMQREYKEEMAWLSANPSVLSLTDTEIKRIRKFFQSSPHDPNRVVASLGGHNVDFKSLSTLIGERYIDNFVINYFLKKTFLFKSKQRSSILCLPSETFLLDGGWEYGANKDHSQEGPSTSGAQTHIDATSFSDIASLGTNMPGPGECNSLVRRWANKEPTNPPLQINGQIDRAAWEHVSKCQ